MKKVMLITGSLNQGGAEFQIIQLAKLLDENGFEVKLLSLTSYDFYENEIQGSGITYQKLSNDVSKLKRVFVCARLIRLFKPDIIVSYLRFTSQVALFSKLLSLHRCKLIIGERTSFTFTVKDLYYFNLMRLSDHIICNSSSKTRYIRSRFKFLEHKTSFIPNILNIERFKIIERSPQDVNFRLSFIGRISPEKNVLLLVDAVSNIIHQGGDITLSLYGDTRNVGYAEEVANLIKDKNCGGKIVLMGKTNDVTQVYKNTDLFCLISKYEGFSNVLSEALACGTIILASDIEENKFLVEDGENGFLVRTDSSEGVSAGIERFLRLSNDERSEISKRNRQKAVNIFDKDKIYKQYLDLFGEI